MTQKMSFGKREFFLPGMMGVMLFSFVLIAPLASAEEAANDGFVEMRDDFEAKTEEVVRLSKREFNDAAVAFEKGSSDLTVLMNQHADCRAAVFAAKGNIEAQTTNLLECSADHAMENSAVLDALTVTTIEVASGIDQTALRFGELARSTKAEIARKRDRQAAIKTEIQTLQSEGRNIGEWLKANPNSQDAEKLLNMRDVYAQTLHLNDRFASMERRINAQELGSERFQALQQEIQLEAMQIRQIGRELGYMGTSQLDYAEEVRETGKMNAAFAQTRGLLETTASLLNSFGKVDEILADAVSERPNPVLMPSSPAPDVRGRLVRDDDIFAYFVGLTVEAKELSQ